MILLSSTLLAALLAAYPGQSQAGFDQFEREVRPVLVRSCYGCHSGAAPKGGLSLDTKSGIQKGGVSGPALVFGDPDKSLLIRAVRHSSGAPSMPPGPPDAKLADGEIAAFARWVKIGAPDPRTTGTGSGSGTGLTTETGARQPSWALKPLHKISPPVIKGRYSSWPHTSIDRFILEKLEAAGLKPSPVADRRTLIRRATYDLTGLPPTPEEVAAFEADRTANAYEKLIDRLLLCRTYGERWGRHWLDVVHYGDTHGYDKDKRRDNAWPYRDYVISSLNADKPYNRFVREQIAGDVLYPEDPQATIATGMLVAGPWDFVGNVELAEATVEKEKTRLLDRDDVVSTVMSTFASVTIHCARCHNHKFDPIPQRDYYKLQAVFAGIDRGDRPYYDREHSAEREQLQKQQDVVIRERDAIAATIAATTSPTIEAIDGHIRELRTQLSQLPAPTAVAGSPSNGYHSDISSQQDVNRWVQVDLGATIPIDSIRLLPARPTDFKDTPGFGFPLRYQVSISSQADFSTRQVVRDDTRADVSNPGDTPVEIPVGATARYVRVTATKLWPRTNDYVFALAEMQVMSRQVNAAVGKAVSAQESIESGRWSARFLVDEYDSRNKLPDMSDPRIAAVVMVRDDLQARIAALESSRRAEIESRIDPVTMSARDRANLELAAVGAKIAAFPPAALVYAAVSHSRRPIWVLNRGDVEQHLDPVGPGALSCVTALPSDFGPAALTNEGQGREDLAEWIVNPANPLTWRSIVNRIWNYHFARGIVDTPNDFGNNGSKPSHPELLDWLAGWFLENGQSLKKLHRMIMLSACYMQTSDSNAAGIKADADNRLLWRMNRRRLEAEEIRDSVLSVSGSLNLLPGGPGFELFKFKDDHSPVYDFAAPDKVTNPATFRRTIYEFIVRSVPDPFLECLDTADPNALTPVRNTTLTALQALAMRNDPFIVSQSDLFAARLAQAAPDPGQELDLAYKLIYGRLPGGRERASVSDYAQKYGLANACRLLLNTNEFLFVD